MKRDLKLTNTDVRICGEECGTDPVSVLEYALDEYKTDQGYDQIFCVFDKEGTVDRHRKYAEACDRIVSKRMPAGKSITAITSVPCFEYWILLHFQFTTAGFVAKGKKSCCDCAVSEIKLHIPDYVKSKPDIYALLKDRTDTAITNAVRANRVAQEADTDHPTTQIGDLVKVLRKAALFED